MTTSLLYRCRSPLGRVRRMLASAHRIGGNLCVELPMQTRRLRAHPKKVVLGVLIASLVLYWAAIASPRYVSEATVVVQRSGDDAVAPSAMLSLIAGNSGDTSDMLMLRERLMSPDVLFALDAQLDLRGHFSDRNRDVLSRLSASTVANERFIDYARHRLDVIYDDYAHTLRIHVQAFSPVMAQRITRALLEEGERFINQLANQQAAEQLRFIDTQLTHFRDGAQRARENLLTFQNRHGLVSPTATVESVTHVIARLDQARAELTASRNMLAVYLTPQAPEMVKISAQIAALSTQIDTERARLTQSNAPPPMPDADHVHRSRSTPTSANADNARPRHAAGADRLNRLAAEQRQWQSEATFAEELYATSRAALERARIDSIRKLKTLAVVQSPTLPQESTQPRRAYSIVVWASGLVLCFALFSLVRAIVREHRD